MPRQKGAEMAIDAGEWDAGGLLSVDLLQSFDPCKKLLHCCCLMYKATKANGKQWSNGCSSW